MKHAKRILQWVVGIVVGLYLAVMLLVNIPFVQRWMANGTSSVLKRILETDVEIGNLEFGWNGRVIVTDLVIDDQQGEEMLRVARVAARPGINDIIHKRIYIGNAQLFGLHANLYQECEGCDPNFKFFIDAFASKDTTKHTPLDLRISQILIRRGNVKWEQRWNKKQIELNDLDVTAQLNCLTDDSLNVRVKRFDVIEKRGFVVKSLAFSLVGNKQGALLTDFLLELPSSSVEIPKLNIHDANIKSKYLGQYAGSVKAQVTPQDLAPLLPQLAGLKDVIDMNLYFQGEDDRVTVPSLSIQDSDGQLRLTASGAAERLRMGKDSLRARVNIQELYAESEHFRPYFGQKQKLMEVLQKLGTVHAKGQMAYDAGEMRGNLDARTLLGNASVSGSGTTKGDIDVTLKSTGLHVGDLLDRSDLGIVALDMKARGKVGKQTSLTAQGRITEADFKGYRYRNVEINNLSFGNGSLLFDLASADPNASFDAKGEADMKNHAYKVKADVRRLSPNMLNLSKRYAGTDFSGTLFVDLKGKGVKDMAGVAQLNGFAMSDSTGTYRPGDIHLTARPEAGGGQQMILISPFLEGQIEGNFDPKVIVSQIKHMVSNYLPSAPINQPITGKSNQQATPLHNGEGRKGAVSFTVRAYNAEPLRRLLGVPITLTGTTVANGEMDSEHNALWLNVTSPGIQYGKEQLRNVALHLESDFESMLANLSLQRQMKGKWINLGLDAQGNEGKLSTRVYFDNNLSGYEEQARTYAGELSVVSRLWQDIEGKQGFEGQILKSDFIISDTIWTMHPGFVRYYDGQLQVDSFQLSQGDRFIRVDGRASKSEADTLHAQLQRINLEYIFSLINFHAVELTGEATGHAYGHSLFSTPKADAYVRIPQFALNYGVMGDLDIHLNWGDRPYSIFLDGDIADLPHQGRTLVKGYITPKKDIDYHGLDLNVKAERVNLEFINKWTVNIFDNLQGRATGWVHIFGPFKMINIEGDAIVNEGSLGVPFIGVRYHLENDSVQLRPDNIYFTNARIYDPQGNPGIEGHQALVTGHLHHNSFKDLSYDILIQGENILGYNFNDFGDQNFYGTVYATGDVTLQGHPGQNRIGIKAHPERGTTFTYNATTPDKLTETPFITYKSKVEKLRELYMKDMEADIAAPVENEVSSGDMYIDFDLDIDEQSTMNLLMDARSGDKISINGSGHMLAHFYNKGSFDLFGTYRVSRGTYNLSVQEFIRKNFEFSPDGTLTFNGEPYEADLDLQAVYTVPSVSLNDINPNANFSSATKRVNCIMNIGGKAREPRITFDFDIPNANEEEKQMVRSLISTEEERNMQVIYLLGIGRFYAYDYANTYQTQGSTAMNSLVSSTLSSTINQALNNMIGLRNWNFGANLRTGEYGWSDMDVEGMLQGSLLNNRLLINGNFGYRDTPVANSNFIGDFDVKYLLTRSGTVALKAYSETNDRYFTKSSLTTQGIGVLLKKDFTSWLDLVTKRKKKTNK